MSSRPKRQGAGQKEKHYPNEPEPEKPEKKPAAAKRTTTPRSPRSPRAAPKKAAAAPKRPQRKRRGKAEESEDDLPPWSKELKKSETTGAALGYIVLPVANVQDAAKVYKELFGFAQRSDEGHSDMWVELDTGSTALAFHKSDAKAAANGPQSSWFVPDIAAFHEKAVKVTGVAVVEAPKQEPWGGMRAQYTDLDGLPFSVVEFNEEKAREMAAEKRKKKKEEEEKAKAAAAPAGGDEKAAATGGESVDEEEDDEPNKKKRSRPKAKSKAKSKKKSAPRKKAKKDEEEEHEGDEAATKKEETNANATAAEHSE